MKIQSPNSNKTKSKSRNASNKTSSGKKHKKQKGANPRKKLKNQTKSTKQEAPRIHDTGDTRQWEKEEELRRHMTKTDESTKSKRKNGLNSQALINT